MKSLFQIQAYLVVMCFMYVPYLLLMHKSIMTIKTKKILKSYILTQTSSTFIPFFQRVQCSIAIRYLYTLCFLGHIPLYTCIESYFMGDNYFYYIEATIWEVSFRVPLYNSGVWKLLEWMQLFSCCWALLLLCVHAMSHCNRLHVSFPYITNICHSC